jgi:hypothetical protein
MERAKGADRALCAGSLFQIFDDQSTSTTTRPIFRRLSPTRSIPATTLTMRLAEFREWARDLSRKTDSGLSAG